MPQSLVRWQFKSQSCGAIFNPGSRRKTCKMHDKIYEPAVNGSAAANSALARGKEPLRTEIAKSYFNILKMFCYFLW